MVRTTVQQLHAAYKRSGWSAAEVVKRSGLDLDRSTLRRKLKGIRPMTTEESEVLAATFNVTIVVVPPQRRVRKRADIKQSEAS